MSTSSREQDLSRELSVKDISKISMSFPTENWKPIFSYYFNFDDARLQQAEYENIGLYIILLVLAIDSYSSIHVVCTVAVHPQQ